MTHMQYAEYLLKNHQSIKREIEIIELDLDLLPQGNKSQFPARGKISKICNVIDERMGNMSREQILGITGNARTELKRLELAMKLLDESVKGVMVDLYVRRLSWDQVCQKHFISKNTLNRRRQKAIHTIADAMSGATISAM